MSKRGLFIVLEGIDGCGKSTQAAKLASFLFQSNKEFDVYLTREPTRDFKELRQQMAIVDGVSVTKDPAWFATTFIADRANHLDKYIEPMLNQGTHVVCDRYKHSTIAFQSAQGMSLENLLCLQGGLLVPDLTIILDCEISTAQERRRSRVQTSSELFEQPEFQQQVRSNYLKIQKILAAKGERVIIISAEGSPNEVWARIAPEVSKLWSSAGESRRAWS